MNEIRKIYHEEHEDLNVCPFHGLAYQRDCTHPVAYDDAYFDKYRAYENTTISRCLNKFRVKFSQGDGAVLDIGVGSLEYLRNVAGRKRYGFDVNPRAKQELINNNWWIDITQGIPEDVGTVTFWDTFEHLTNPSELLASLPSDVEVCLSLPIFKDVRDLDALRASKHYRPNEHFLYFTRSGLRHYFWVNGFFELDFSCEESRCGRENIESFRWRKL